MGPDRGAFQFVYSGWEMAPARRDEGAEPAAERPADPASEVRPGAPSPVGDGAVEAQRQVVDGAPGSAHQHRHFAELLLNRGFLDEAEAEFHQTLSLDPEDMEARLGLARVLHARGEDSTALFMVKQVIRSTNQPSHAYLLYARLLFALGSVERAVQEYEKALKADPEARDPELAESLRGGESRGRRSAAVLRTPAYLFSERPRITYGDVGGLEGMIREIRQKYLQPFLDSAGDQRPAGGRLLFYGPPGCGKTHFARATAGELLGPPFLGLDFCDLVDVWLGRWRRIVPEVFAEARRRRPCALLFDDLEPPPKDRGEARRAEATRRVTRDLVAELQAGEANRDLLILVTTRQPWAAEPDLAAPGLLDRVFFLPPPDPSQRVWILRTLCRSKPVAEVDYDHVARKTEGFSASDLAAVVDRAVARKLTQSLDEGQVRPLTTMDLVLAVESLRPEGPEAWLAEARERAALGGRDRGFYADLRRHLLG